VSLRFLAVGDIHYESIALYYPEKHLELVNQVLSQIWFYAKKNGIKHVFLLGDIFHTPYPDDSSKKAFLSTLDKCLHYHIILGNHDVSTSSSNSMVLLKYFIEDYGLADNINFYFEPVNLTINDAKFNLLPFPYKNSTCTEKSICMGHFEVNGAQMDNGAVVKNATDLDKNNFWILGHLHTRQGTLYPGSVVQTRFGENHNKYFFDCIYENDSLNIEAVKIKNSYNLLDVKVKTFEELKAVKFNDRDCYRIYASDKINMNDVLEATKGYNIYKVIGVSANNLNKSIAEEVSYEDFSELTDDKKYLRLWLSNPKNCSLDEKQIEKALEIVEKLK